MAPLVYAMSIPPEDGSEASYAQFEKKPPNFFDTDGVDAEVAEILSDTPEDAYNMIARAHDERHGLDASMFRGDAATITPWTLRVPICGKEEIPQEYAFLPGNSAEDLMGIHWNCPFWHPKADPDYVEFNARVVEMKDVNSMSPVQDQDICAMMENDQDTSGYVDGYMLPLPQPPDEQWQMMDAPEERSPTPDIEKAYLTVSSDSDDDDEEDDTKGEKDSDSESDLTSCSSRYSPFTVDRAPTPFPAALNPHAQSFNLVSSQENVPESTSSVVHTSSGTCSSSQPSLAPVQPSFAGPVVRAVKPLPKTAPATRTSASLQSAAEGVFKLPQQPMRPVDGSSVGKSLKRKATKQPAPKPQKAVKILKVPRKVSATLALPTPPPSGQSSRRATSTPDTDCAPAGQELGAAAHGHNHRSLDSVRPPVIALSSDILQLALDTCKALDDEKLASSREASAEWAASEAGSSSNFVFQASWEPDQSRNGEVSGSGSSTAGRKRKRKADRSVSIEQQQQDQSEEVPHSEFKIAPEVLQNMSKKEIKKLVMEMQCKKGPIYCPYRGCTQVCKSIGDLGRHLDALAHKKPDKKCLNCAKKFTRFDALKRHWKFTSDCLRWARNMGLYNRTESE